MNSQEAFDSRALTPGCESTSILSEKAVRIHEDQCPETFLMQLITSGDLWCYLGSNGAITAGRKDPDHALFPYTTQDKLYDSFEHQGSLTLVRCTPPNPGHPALWRPWQSCRNPDLNCRRSVSKSLTGTKIRLEEHQPLLNLHHTVTWTTSESYGLIRHVTLENLGDSLIDLEVLDGILNILPAGLDQAFQNEFSNLADAYKRSEWQSPFLATYSLSSLPTDKAEPNESLVAGVAWSSGFPAHTHLLSTRQMHAFTRGIPLSDENDVRGVRGAFLLVGNLRIPAHATVSWWTACDTGLSGSRVVRLIEAMKDPVALGHRLAASIAKTTSKIDALVSGIDGIQITACVATDRRHYANALFNLMRGGTFPKGYSFPKSDLLKHLQTCNQGVFQKHRSRLESLPERTTLDSWTQLLASLGDKDLSRIANEYLPLSFSRRHGDPSRPWNRFNIEVADESGHEVLSYQGNWRDIFQNWEALLHAYPAFTDAVIARFLNASTYDGYNPYRITKTGYEWEREEADTPWSNIGYWGDHQIIYLLKLLEWSRKIDPPKLLNMLDEAQFVFGEVPYRIHDFQQLWQNPRTSITYDHNWSQRLDERKAALGSDGYLLQTSSHTLLYASLLEKLLIPALTKLSNFVPGAGIWMNTQRPEWNDANNALAGYGASVVTLGYLLRYLSFLEKLLEDSSKEYFTLHLPVATLLRRITLVCSEPEANFAIKDPKARHRVVAALVGAGSAYRKPYYEQSVDDSSSTIQRIELLQAIRHMLQYTALSLRSNERGDGLYHAYNLLSMDHEGILGVERLPLMLEGQVSILSSGLLNPEQGVRLLDALRGSELYRADQNSYTLYPDKALPTFLDKGKVDREAASAIHTLAEHVRIDCKSILETDLQGDLRFHPTLRNRACLEAVLAKYQIPVNDHQAILDLYESTFQHRAFAGRSGSFFAYEGLGSIYWHMVSKLLLAVQEVLTDPARRPRDPEILTRWRTYYLDIKEGIGAKKTPRHYGAFPSDPYSHTPANRGAQQPGMTGQVKEDLLVRFGELGVHVIEGGITFEPLLLDEKEFLEDASELAWFGLDGKEQRIAVPQGSLAFTMCHTPIIYHRSHCSKDYIEIQIGNERVRVEGNRLEHPWAQKVFLRTGDIQKITVTFKQATPQEPKASWNCRITHAFSETKNPD